MQTTPTRQTYTPEDVDRGLVALIYCGSSEQAAERLAEQGLNIPARTLRDWQHSKAERLAELQNQHGPEIEKALVEQQRSIAFAAQSAALEAIHAARNQLANGEAKDPAGMARNLQTTAAISVDKLLALTGRPTSITAHFDLDASLRKLESLKIADVIQSTATEPSTPLLPESASSNAQD